MIARNQYEASAPILPKIKAGSPVKAVLSPSARKAAAQRTRLEHNSGAETFNSCWVFFLIGFTRPRVTRLGDQQFALVAEAVLSKLDQLDESDRCKSVSEMPGDEAGRPLVNVDWRMDGLRQLGERGALWPSKLR
jgi:hypothetical protein